MIVALTHGAGSNSDSPLLRTVDAAFSNAGIQIVRYDLPFRIAQHKTPLRGDAERDRAGIRDTIARLRRENPGEQIIAGGHSYGGRQTSMLLSEQPALANGLVLLSYPLHPPRRPDQLRTDHFPNLRTPVLFVHGTRDPFGSPEEMTTAVTVIPAPKQIVFIERTGHDLIRNAGDIGKTVVDACRAFFAPPLDSGHHR